MTDSDESDKPMTVTLHKENEPDFSVEEGAFDTVGVSVDNAVPIGVLEDLAEEMEKYGSTDVDRFTAKLNWIIADYGGTDD